MVTYQHHSLVTECRELVYVKYLADSPAVTSGAVGGLLSWTSSPLAVCLGFSMFPWAWRSVWRVGGREGRQKSSIFQKGALIPVPGGAARLPPDRARPPAHTRMSSSDSQRPRAAAAGHPLQEAACVSQHPWSQHRFIQN